MPAPARSGVSPRLSAALWSERRLPGLARRLQPSPVLKGEPGSSGTVYRGSDRGPLLVVAGEPDFPPHWLGSALASAIGGVAVVLPPSAPVIGRRPVDRDDDHDADAIEHHISAAIASAAEHGADADRVAVVGAGSGCAAALRAVSDARTAPAVRRLVLLAPTDAPRVEFGSVPPAFLQSSPQSPALSVSRSLEIDLREAGVAVRPVEYAGLADAWVRYPTFARGSRRAIEDIISFLRRGFGMAGTFSVEIPGWDLK